MNRLWDHFLGRGFVHPVDDLDKANPPSHPELMDLMARQFAAQLPGGHRLEFRIEMIEQRLSGGALEFSAGLEKLDRLVVLIAHPITCTLARRARM